MIGWIRGTDHEHPLLSLLPHHPEPINSISHQLLSPDALQGSAHMQAAPESREQVSTRIPKAREWRISTPDSEQDLP